MRWPILKTADSLLGIQAIPDRNDMKRKEMRRKEKNVDKKIGNILSMESLRRILWGNAAPGAVELCTAAGMWWGVAASGFKKHKKHDESYTMLGRCHINYIQVSIYAYQFTFEYDDYVA